MEGNYPRVANNEMRVFLSSTATCAQETVAAAFRNVDLFIFRITDFSFSELYVCLAWDAQSTPRVIPNTSVVMKDVHAIGMSVGIVGQKQSVSVRGVGLNSGDKVLFAQDFCTSAVHNGPFTVKASESGLFFEAEWSMASDHKMVMCYMFLGSNKYYAMAGFERYVIAIEPVTPSVVRVNEEETVRIATNKVPQGS